MGLQELTELVATALIMKEAMFCSNMMKGLGFGTRFDSVPLHLDNTSTLHVAGNQTYSPRVKHVVLRYFFVQKLARREGQISIHYVKRPVQRLGGGRGCNILVPVLGGNGAKIAPTGDLFDQAPVQMR